MFRDDQTTSADGRQTRQIRAMRAAREMRVALQTEKQSHELALGIGVVSGPVLAGVIGTSAVRLEFTVIGDTVNLASRLGDVAGQLPGGGIVVERNLVDFLRRHTDWNGVFETLPVKTVKGKKREVEVFLLKS